MCDNPSCTDVSHHGAIDYMSRSIVDALQTASVNFHTKARADFRAVPGWNSYCKELHGMAREAYLCWRDSGKARHGILFENMKKSRAQFKYALRSCKKNSSRNQADSLAANLLRRDDKAFWKEIKKINDNSVPLSTTVNNVTGEQAISEMWHTHFKSILNSSTDVSNKHVLLETLNDKNDYKFDRFTVNEVLSAVQSLKNGKSAGKDMIYAEHYKYAHDKCSILLMILFNMCVIHGYIPQSIMDTIITPILKDKKGDITDGDNYRPVAVTCIISKILELIVLKRYSHLLSTTCNQFGFKKKLGTDMCIYTLKQVVEYYKSLSGPVFIAFMDASKAFDKINHYHLLVKLLKRNIPKIIVRMLFYWFRHQEFIIRWGNSLSKPFKVCNGVRQGGIASPIFFNMYMDDLSIKLSQSSYGCNINDCKVNHIFYADDSSLMAPSAKALQELINICVNYSDKYELTFNVKKTKIMCCFATKYSSPKFYIKNSLLDIVHDYKYLGVIVTDSWSDNDDICRQMRGIYTRGNMIIKRFVHCSDVVKARLFRSYCSTFYCSQLWSSYSGNCFNKLQTSFNRIFRHLFRLHGQVSISNKCLEYGIDCFKVVIRKSIFGFRDRILCSENSIIQAIGDSSFFLSCNLTSQWNHLLFTFNM